jgi:hypothetical protein
MNNLPITNIITVSVAQQPQLMGEFNVNNVLLLTSDAFLSNPNSDAFRAYQSPAAVLADFGLSTTYNMANAMFLQNPNVLNGNGQLIIAPFAYGETMVTAIARLDALVPFCGILSTNYPTGEDRKTLAIAVEGYKNKILWLPSATYSDVAGVFTEIQTATLTKTRCLLYGSSLSDALLFAASACGRGQSVDFNGSNTTLTLNLKQLVGILPDSTITQTVLNSCKTAGVDVYVNIQGVPEYISTGGNDYFDNVYNLIWLVNELSVTGFNVLAGVSTKVPQTEKGMSLIKSAFRSVMEQAVANQMIAPGQWNSAEWFGNQADMSNNIQERGYYIYSMPVNAQTEANREARIAPSIQIAAKLAGAVQQINVVLSINA